MQKIQPTKRYYKMYKKGRFWVVAGITVMAAGISPMVVHADTADTATTTAITADVDATGKHASSTPVPASAEAQSVAPVSTEQTGSAASTSAANDSSATNVASSAPAPASVTSEAGSQTAGSGAVTSAAPASANEAGSGVPANSTAPSAVDSGTPSSATSAAPSNGSAAPASNAPETTSSAAATESTASKGKLMAKRALRAPAAAVASVDPDEQDLSDQFTDANLLAAVRRGFDLADGASLTMNTIKTYKSSHFEVKAYTVTNGEIEYYPVTNLQGLQVLANLPAETTTAVDIQLGDDSNSVSNFDFSPLESIKIWNLNLYTRYWSFVSDKQLQLIAGLDTSTIHNLEFSSPNKFKKNPDGMTNHQFNILAPFVKAVLENHFPGSQMIGFSGNNITDFSALKSVSPTQSSQVTGLFEWDFRTDKLAYNAGDTVEVESALTGVQGESVNYTVRYYQDNGTAEGELVAADAHEETVTNPDGTTRTVWKYTLVNPLVVNNEIRYGTYYYDDSLWTKYKTDINGNPLSDFGSALGAFTIQPVTSSKATLTFNPSEVVMGPNATWNYLDHVASATDYDGNPISQDKWNTLNITNVNGLPDLTKAGWQTVEFTFTDDKGIVLTATAAVNVLASQASIWAKADQIVWPKEVSDIKASDLVASVTDAYGNPVTDFTTVQMSALDAAKAGAQLVTLTYTDEAGNQVTATLNVTVDLATLATQPVKVVVGPNAKWKYEMNLLGVTDSLGQPLAVDKATIKVVTGPDLTVVKPQTVVLEYTDDLGRTQRFEAQVTTIQSQAAITANDDLIVWPKEVGGLTVAELVRNVTDMNGNAVTDLTNVTMSGVDSTKPGAQPVTLTYTDAAGNQVTTTINVTVDLATLTTKDVQLVAGPTAKWDYKANLESVLDSRGQAIDVTTAKVKVVTGPDLSDAKVGVPQTVVLEYTDDLGRTQHFNATVTTTKTQATITAKDDPIVWPAEVADLTVTDLVHSVTDANGQAVPDLTGVTMSKVDPAKAGVQPITLTYTDAAGNQVTTTINVTVDLASLTTKDVQLVAGPTVGLRDELDRRNR
ncbi:hypothetical protein D1831_08285 [Lactiplantibacillus garii]|uniref:Ig-like domain-containing protein n=1 Tax=Lactiplantibacillus garii TaxID=2306423 RepID=A0A426D6N3_9LACO|nr:bacterial Ig-like domain-containing protein [Lactiplantibacillus garii]RRK10306.1 hypothetical protein D1831_08285 [Lactiplantibacillus garii]